MGNPKEMGIMGEKWVGIITGSIIYLWSLRLAYKLGGIF